MGLVAGIDVGSQGVKVLLYDFDARRVVAVRRAPLAMDVRSDGSREQRATWWVDAIRRCFAGFDKSTLAGVAAVGVSGQQHGLVALDTAGEPLVPVKLWCDTSTQRECDEITGAIGSVDRCVQLGGNPILVGYTASKVRWLRRAHPECYRRLATILLPHDYVNFWLTGERWMECGDASGTGWFDVRRRMWSVDLLRAIDSSQDLREYLPPLVAPDASFPIDPGVARELGLPESTTVSAGGGDNMMAAIGTGCVIPGVVGVSLGTSGTVFTYAEHPVVDAAGAWAAFCASTGGWLPLVCTMNCTLATEQVARACGFDVADGDSLLDQTMPGAGGVLMLPYLNGERTPNLPTAQAAIHGLTAVNLTAANVYRAAMEGATFALRYGCSGWQHAGLNPAAIRLTGGGSHSAVWRQMVADVFDLPVTVPEEVEGAAFGAALQALWAYDHASGGTTAIAALIQQHVRVSNALSVHPQEAAVAGYRQPYAQFRERVRELVAVSAANHLRGSTLSAVG